MAIQLAFDFNTKPTLDHPPLITKDAWLDVSEIARGVGFVEAVQVSPALHDELEHQRDDYHQLLYDVVWLAHLKLSLDQWQSATFNFPFPNRDPPTEEPVTVSLRLRAELHDQIVLLGLLQDFQEAF